MASLKISPPLQNSKKILLRFKWNMIQNFIDKAFPYVCLTQAFQGYKNSVFLVPVMAAPVHVV